MKTRTIQVDESKIRAAREAAGLTTAEAASRLGITYQYMWALEQGIKSPSWEMLTGLCELFGQGVTYFLSGPEKILEKV